MLKKLGGKFKFAKIICIPIICIGLLSCSESDIKKAVLKDSIIDDNANLTRDDYEKTLIPPRDSEDAKHNKFSKDNKDKKNSADVPAIPEATEILTAPKAPEAGPDKLVSISVTEDVPLKDVLIELGRLAGVDMEIDPGITGGIIMQATNRPFNEVLKSVVDLGNLRYESKNGTIKIERDLPYQVDYVTDFLNIIRSSNGSVSVSTNVIGNGSSGSSGSSGTGTSGTGSTSTGSTNTASSNGSNGSSSSSSSGSGNGGISSGSGEQINTSYEGDLWKSVESTIKAMVADTSTGAAASAAANSAAGPNAAKPSDESVNINRPAGIISVVATQKQHRTIEAYLNNVKKNISSQVLIEAKIVEVTLNKNFSSGVNWGTLADKNSGLTFAGNFAPSIASVTSGAGAAAATATTGAITIGAATRSLNSTVSLLDQFGTSHTLASPRLHAMNNQQAVMTVAQNQVYFTVAVTNTTTQLSSTVSGTTTTSPNTTANVTSTLHTVPIGLIMTLQPSINLDTNEITMNIRPTLTTTSSSVNDPAVDLTSQQNIAQFTGPAADAPKPITSAIPVINVREFDSVMKIKSGEIMIMGGLMTNTTSNTDNGVPGLSKIPFVGNAFKSVTKGDSTVETVIFIKATIIPSDVSSVTKADKNIYKTFIRDPHPLAF